MAPIVREYEADVNPAGPTETRQARDMDTGNVGGALSRVGAQIADLGGQIHQRDVQNEVSDLSAKLAAAHEQFTDDLKNTLNNADPNDKSISDKFMQNYDDQMSEISDSVSTPEAQRYFERANAQMRAHFTVQSVGGQAALAGEAATSNIQTMASNYSSSLIKDPSSFDTVKNLSAAAIQEQVDAGRIPKQKASELQAQIETGYAQSAIQGMIQSGQSGQAIADLKSGKWGDYFDGQQTFKMMKEAEQGVNAERIQAERQDSLQRQALAKAQEASQNDFLARMQPDADNPLTAQDILKSNLDPFGSGSKDQFLKMLKASGEEKIKTDPQAYLGIAQRIGLPDGDPNKITDDGPLYNAFEKGQLTHGALNELREELKGGKSDQGQQLQQLKNNFLQTAKDKLTKTNPMIGIKDPDGDEVYQKFMGDFFGQFNSGLKSGKTAQQMLTPGSKDYLGNLVQIYQRSPQDILKSAYAPESSNAPSSTTTQSVPPLTTPSGSGRQGGSPPAGLSFEEFRAWKAKH